MDTSILLNLGHIYADVHGLGGYSSLGFITLSIIWSTHREIPGLGLWWWSSLLCPGGPVAASSCRRSPPHISEDLAGQPAHHPLHRADATGAAASSASRRTGGPSHSSWLVYLLILPAGACCSTTRWPQGVAGLPELHGAGAVVVVLIWRHGWLSGLPAGGAECLPWSTFCSMASTWRAWAPCSAARRGCWMDPARGQCAALPLHADGQLPSTFGGAAALYPVPGTGPASAVPARIL